MLCSAFLVCADFAFLIEPSLSQPTTSHFHSPDSTPIPSPIMVRQRNRQGMGKVLGALLPAGIKPELFGLDCKTHFNQGLSMR